MTMAYLHARSPQCTITGELATYAAGLFDGEGCVTINHSLCRGRSQWYMTAIIKMSDREPLELLQATWGGALYDHPKRDGLKQQTSWRIGSRRAAQFLRDVEPHVRSTRRRKAIGVAISFQSQKRSPGPKGVTDAYRRLQDDFIGLIRHLNARGPALDARYAPAGVRYREQPLRARDLQHGDMGYPGGLADGTQGCPITDSGTDEFAPPAVGAFPAGGFPLQRGEVGHLEVGEPLLHVGEDGLLGGEALAFGVLDAGELPWGYTPDGDGEEPNGEFGGLDNWRNRWGGRREQWTRGQHRGGHHGLTSTTPPAFRDALIAMARTAQRVAA